MNLKRLDFLGTPSSANLRATAEPLRPITITAIKRSHLAQ